MLRITYNTHPIELLLLDAMPEPCFSWHLITQHTEPAVILKVLLVRAAAAGNIHTGVHMRKKTRIPCFSC